TAASAFYLQNGPATPQNASLNISGDAAIGGNVTITGKLIGGGIPSLDASNVEFSGAVSAGSLSAGSVSSTGGISGASVTSSGSISGASLSSTGVICGASVTSSGTISG